MPLKNVTITLTEEAARWARRKAADENTSVSKLVGRIIEREMRQTPEYWKAYEEWKKRPSLPGIASAPRLTRDDLHERA